MTSTLTAQNDMTGEQVRQFLNIPRWRWRSVKKQIPAIVYAPKVKRWALADVLHYREGLKQGGWIGGKS